MKRLEKAHLEMFCCAHIFFTRKQLLHSLSFSKIDKIDVALSTRYISCFWSTLNSSLSPEVGWRFDVCGVSARQPGSIATSSSGLTLVIILSPSADYPLTKLSPTPEMDVVWSQRRSLCLVTGGVFCSQHGEILLTNIFNLKRGTFLSLSHSA